MSPLSMASGLRQYSCHHSVSAWGWGHGSKTAIGASAVSAAMKSPPCLSRITSRLASWLPPDQ